MVNFKRSSTIIKGYGSELAKGEKNDCFVRALASATEVNYDVAHKFTKDYFGRANGKGVYFTGATINPLEEKGLSLGNKDFDFKVLNKMRITNGYKLYGEMVYRQKTVKSFIKDNPKGTYIVGVAGHAFTIKDGTLIDNADEKFRPTRKVTSVFQLKSKRTEAKQLSLFA
jgi:hypothetical protein